ncbi:MAG: B12-binding domain-containing radical SAM protein [Chloroflexi bacterium]|nr:B12-binding domain-containing radical SAM protein [Chloroflexota bacterium]
MKKVAGASPEAAFFIVNFLGCHKFTYSMGTAYIAAYLREKGVESKIISGGSSDLISFLEEVKKSRIRILGIPSYDIAFSNIRVIAGEARRIIPDLLIASGGPSATFADEIYLKNIPEIDVIVRGEGEETVFDLYRHTAGETDLEDIQGISFRRGDEIIRTGDRPLISAGEKGSELDVLPSPFKTGILTGLEWKPGMQTSRGCVYPCTFCCGPSMFGGKIRCHSVNRVIEDLKIMSENMGGRRKKTWVDFWDDNLCLDAGRTRRLCEAIISEGLKFDFHAQARPDNLDRQTLELMSGAGVRCINLGLESAVPRVLRNIGKVGGRSPDFTEEKEYIESVRRVVKDCKDLGIMPTVSIISGLPGETYEEGLATVKMIDDLKLDAYYHNYFMVYVGTDVYRDSDKNGLNIRHGKRILPAAHDYPYDVEKIPVLPNALSLEHSLSFIQSSESALFEWGELKSTLYEEIGPHLVMEDCHEIDGKTQEWLKRILSFFSEMIFRYDEGRPTVSEIGKIKEVLRRGLLTRPAIVLEKSGSKMPGGVEHYRLKTDLYKKFPLYCPSDYYSYPFHKARRTERNSSDNRVVFYDICSREDVEFFIREMKSPPSDIEGSVIGKMIKDEILLAASCRFTGKCPARSLEKIHVRKNGDLVVCRHGIKTGVVGDSMETLDKKVSEMALSEDRKRKCSDCPAKDRCARCLFTEPFTVEEYCDFVRSAGWLPRMLRFLLLCHDSRLKKNFFEHFREGKGLKT